MRVLYEFINTRGEVTAERRGNDVALHFTW
jgi:hypothetical protein